MNANNNEWQTAKTIADDLGVTPSAITYAERNNGAVAGQHVESRMVTPADRKRLDLTPQSRRLYRLVPRIATETVDDLLADLAGCEARIEELEAELANAGCWPGESVSISAHKEVLAGRDEYIMALKSECAELSKKVADTSKGSISIAAHRDALEQKDRYIQQLRSAARDAEESLEDLMAEVEKWKAKAEREASARWRAEYVRDGYAELLDEARGANMRAYEAGKREAREQQLNRSIVRRAVRRAMEVVR